MKKRTKRVLLVVLGGVIVLGVAGVLLVDYMMKQSLYKVGSVRSGENLRGPLEPPEQTDDAHWQVETDIQLHFDAFGEGTPVVVVHGGPGIPYAGAWKGLEQLTDRFQFFYYHQRGCGESTRPLDRFESRNYYANMTELERSLGLGAQIADIERIRQILGQDQLAIIGHSYGGFIASLYAAEFPDRVDKLLLVAPAGVLTAPDEDRNIFARAREKVPVEQQAAYDELLDEYFDFGNIFSKTDADLVALQGRLAKFLLPAMGYETEPFETGPTSGGWAVFAMYFSSGRAPNYRPAVANITAPTLIVHGRDDELALAGSRTYEQTIPNARFVSIAGNDPSVHAGHFVFDDCPDEFAIVVEEFLSTQPPQADGSK